MQDDLIAVVGREELPHFCARVTAQRVKPAVGIHVHHHRHCSCVRLQRRRAVVVGMDPAQHMKQRQS